VIEFVRRTVEFQWVKLKVVCNLDREELVTVICRCQESMRDRNRDANERDFHRTEVHRVLIEVFRKENS